MQIEALYAFTMILMSFKGERCQKCLSVATPIHATYLHEQTGMFMYTYRQAHTHVHEANLL